MTGANGAAFLMQNNFLVESELCCKSKDFLFYVKEKAKWKFKETLLDFAECLCFTSDEEMLLGHVKQNNEQGGVNFNVLTYEFWLCRIWAERGRIRSLSARTFTLHRLVLSSLTPPQLSLLFLQSLSPFSPLLQLSSL